MMTLNTVMAHHGIVAIVDDDPEIRQALGAWLALYDLQAASYPSAESFYATLQIDGDHLAIRCQASQPARRPLLGAVLDLKLPGQSGMDLAHTLRGLAPELPLVIITALQEEEISHYGTPPPGLRCLRKPFDLDLLEGALEPLFHPVAAGTV
ncbi:MAG TPA: hypothetical protein DCS21_10300 [Gammaproteobacteria bacterium]|nr:hypothetical protein [Gammaproteobacteria bacterium]